MLYDKCRIVKRLFAEEGKRRGKRGAGSFLESGIVRIAIKDTHMANATIDDVEIHPSRSDSCCTQHLVRVKKLG